MHKKEGEEEKKEKMEMYCTHVRTEGKREIEIGPSPRGLYKQKGQLHTDVTNPL